jgi:hypothetical protein
MNRIRRMGFPYLQHLLLFILCILLILSQFPSSYPGEFL